MHNVGTMDVKKTLGFYEDLVNGTLSALSFGHLQVFLHGVYVINCRGRIQHPFHVEKMMIRPMGSSI